MGNQQGHDKIDMYETSTGTLLAIQAWVDNIVESIVGFCSFNATRQNLRLKEAFLEQSQDNQKLLEANLKAMQNTVTNLRINHHFLSHTLNAIASQALLGDEIATYQAITDLSKMLGIPSLKIEYRSSAEELELLQNISAAADCP